MRGGGDLDFVTQHAISSTRRGIIDVSSAHEIKAFFYFMDRCSMRVQGQKCDSYDKIKENPLDMYGVVAPNQ